MPASDNETSRQLETAILLTKTLAQHPVDRSLSFMLDDHGQSAAAHALGVLQENYPSNYTQLRSTVLELFESFSSSPPKTPLNVRFEEEDIKALEYAVDVLERERE